MASMTKCIVYILYHVIHENTVIYWAQIISNASLFQLGSIRKTKKICMTSYLIYAIVYCHFFKDLLKDKNVDFKKDPISF
jgi:hypothetical protein